MARKLTQPAQLSVSSNGSTWVKPNATRNGATGISAFSILERIDVGETFCRNWSIWLLTKTFSILERIDVGETH